MADGNPNTQNLPMQTRGASFVPASFNAEASTIDVIWSTGAKVRRYSWARGEWFDEELVLEPDACDLSRLNAGASFLNSHDSYDLDAVLGSVVPGSARLDKGAGVATIQLSQRADLAPIIGDIKAGIIRNISIGYNVRRYQIDETQGEIPVYRAIEWTPAEISAVAIPADAGAQTRQQGKGMLPCHFESRATAAHLTSRKELPMDEDEKKAAADKAAGKTPETDQSRAAPVSEPAKITPAAPAMTPVAEVRKIVSAAKLADSVALDMVERGLTIDQVRKEVLDKLAADSGHEINGQVRVTTDAVDKFRTGAVKALMLRGGFSEKNGGERNEFTGLNLRELARESLSLHNVTVRGVNVMEMIGHAFTYRAGGMHSTSDFSFILANVANKSMLKGYLEAEETFQQWTASGTLTDFKPTKRVDLNLFPALLEVPEGAEYKHGTIGDRGETVQLATYGRMFSITRQAIINDDMDAFTKIPSRMGRAAIRTIGNLVYAVITSNPNMSDGVALFHANHGNLAGAGAAPAVGTIDAARVAMGIQKDPDKNAAALNISPKWALVPKALEGATNVIQRSEFDPSKTQRVPNTVAGTFQVIAEARLDTASATAWYMAADSGTNDTVEVSYLEGQKEPVLEQQNGWNIDGTEMKVRLDAAVKALDFRGLYKNAGQ